MFDLHLKIVLVDVKKPPVNRTIIVPGGYTFSELHNVIRAAFRIREKGVFEFNNSYIGGDFVCMPLMNADFEIDDVEKVVNADFEIIGNHIKEFDLLSYFFDDWILDIELLGTTPAKVDGPVLVKGTGKIAMDHCGGNLMYMAMVETFNETPDSKAAFYFRKMLNLRKNEMPDFTLDKEEKALINLRFRDIAYASADHHKMLDEIKSNFANKMAELMDNAPFLPRAPKGKKSDKLN